MNNKYFVVTVTPSAHLEPFVMIAFFITLDATIRYADERRAKGDTVLMGETDTTHYCLSNAESRREVVA